MNPVRLEFDEKGWFAYMTFGPDFIGRGETRCLALECLANQFTSEAMRRLCAEAAANCLSKGLL